MLSSRLVCSNYCYKFIDKQIQNYLLSLHVWLIKIDCFSLWEVEYKRVNCKENMTLFFFYSQVKIR